MTDKEIKKLLLAGRIDASQYLIKTRPIPWPYPVDVKWITLLSQDGEEEARSLMERLAMGWEFQYSLWFQGKRIG